MIVKDGLLIIVDFNVWAEVNIKIYILIYLNFNAYTWVN